MTIAILVAVCIVLLVMAFLMPRLSEHPQRGVDKSRKATNRSASAGRRARGKLPL